MSQLEALERTLAAGQSKLGREQDALVELCRLLAEQIDCEPEASTRLTAAYLSALKDLGRVLNERKGAVGDSSRLASVRGIRDVDKPTKKRASA